MRLCLLTCVLASVRCAAPRGRDWLTLPVDLGADPVSGCSCRASADRSLVVCFGGYLCSRFPEVNTKSDVLRVRTTSIEEIRAGHLDRYSYLRALDIDANHQLKFIEPGAFAKLNNLEQLSISFCSALVVIQESMFEGLSNLRNLTMVNNGFESILSVMPALRSSILPSLETLDLSENFFEVIPEETFSQMKGSLLKRLDLNLCQIDYIHANSFNPLKMLRKLDISENDLNATTIESFLVRMFANGINLTSLNLSALSLRKHPPRSLLRAVAGSSVRELQLARNQFEMILDNDFPQMHNIEELDLRKVSAVYIGPNAFDPRKFPKLKVLLLGWNYLAGVQEGHASSQLEMLDLSYNTVSKQNLMYFEMTSDTFRDYQRLISLNLSFNRIKAIYYYTFRGLDRLKTLHMENGTIYYIGPGTFKYTRQLETLNLAFNPVTANSNLTRRQFEGLINLKTFDLSHCNIKYLDDQDNIFEEMTNVSHLLLRNNQLYFLKPLTLHPLVHLELIDLRDNYMVASVSPLFLGTDVLPHTVMLSDNKITHITAAMLEDMNYLLQFDNNTVIELGGNIFDCDCGSMYAAHAWIEKNSSAVLKQYFEKSSFLCASPDLWEDRRVAEYLASMRSVQCLVYGDISSFMLVAWTTPSIILICIIAVIIFLVIKFKIYVGYWFFLAKIAIGRRLTGKAVRQRAPRSYKYDAFVSYSNEDRDFVLEMVSELESKPPHLKLCVYERDFEIGTFISEAVLNSINESRYIILNISNNFAQSQWCRWEAQLAEYRRVAPDAAPRDPLVLIRIGSVDAKYLSTTLKYLLKTKIYLTWDERNSEQFWHRLRSVLLKN